MNQDLMNITSQLRTLGRDVESLRIKYNEEVRQHQNTKRLLNYIMRDLKEYTVPSDFHLDFTLLPDCVLIKNNSVDKDNLELFYSLDELEKWINEFKGLNGAEEMLKVLNKYKEIYEEED